MDERLEKGSAKLRYSNKEEIIEVSLDNSIVYNGKTYKSIDDFILNEVELKKKFDQVFEII